MSITREDYPVLAAKLREILTQEREPTVYWDQAKRQLITPETAAIELPLDEPLQANSLLQSYYEDLDDFASFYLTGVKPLDDDDDDPKDSYRLVSLTDDTNAPFTYHLLLSMKQDTDPEELKKPLARGKLKIEALMAVGRVKIVAATCAWALTQYPELEHQVFFAKYLAGALSRLNYIDDAIYYWQYDMNKRTEARLFTDVAMELSGLCKVVSAKFGAS